MRSNVARSLVALVAAACAAAFPCAAPAAGTGLSAAQARSLHRLGYAVVPKLLPAGFRVASVSTAPDGSSYRVLYVRSSDGATFTISGRRSKGGGAVAAATPAPKKRGGFLASITSAIGGIGKKPQGAGTSAESEQPLRSSAAVADSRLIGPTHFASEAGCLKGVADSSQAIIQNASFTVQACNFPKTDPVVSAYRSVARV
ncbi:MAG TPA: hypothetical protein VFB22_17960 [Candidatus Baltobacteraceae bacterium]|nr:hypothetical protein [Candidatus Baltobacteraceae bacterium]